LLSPLKEKVLLESGAVVIMKEENIAMGMKKKKKRYRESLFCLPCEFVKNDPSVANLNVVY
jgi:hypothetical protein